MQMVYKYGIIVLFNVVIISKFIHKIFYIKTDVNKDNFYELFLRMINEVRNKFANYKTTSIYAYGFSLKKYFFR